MSVKLQIKSITLHVPSTYFFNEKEHEKPYKNILNDDEALSIAFIPKYFKTC